MAIKSAPPYTDLDIEFMRAGFWEPVKPADNRRRASHTTGLRQFRPCGRAAR